MKQRIITALIVLPLVFVMLWLGGWPFALFITLVLATAGYEWNQLFQKKGFQPAHWITIGGIVVFAGLGFFWGIQYDHWFWLVFLFVGMAFAIIQYENGTSQLPVDFLIHLGGVAYIGGLGRHFIFVRQLTNGGWWFFFFMALTALGDTAAYVIGKQWGKHKLGRYVSPNKSWEGLISGFVMAALVGLTFSLVAPTWFSFKSWCAMVFAGLLYVVSIIGDLGVSMFKRWAGVKNTGNLLPGHGGVLDRIDAHLWTMAIGYQLLILFLPPG